MNINKRYITVKESLKQSCKEVKEMRSGKIKKTAWDDFIDEMKYFCGEEGNKNRT